MRGVKCESVGKNERVSGDRRVRGNGGGVKEGYRDVERGRERERRRRRKRKRERERGKGERE